MKTNDGYVFILPSSFDPGNMVIYTKDNERIGVIEGDLIAEGGELRICDGAVVNRIISTGDVFLRKDVSAAEVRGNNILVLGKVKCGKLMGKNTRVVSGDI